MSAATGRVARSGSGTPAAEQNSPITGNSYRSIPRLSHQVARVRPQPDGSESPPFPLSLPIGNYSVRSSSYTSPSGTCVAQGWARRAPHASFERFESRTEPPWQREEDSVAKEDRGFASMDRAKRREIASKGGKAAHQKGTAHEWTSEEARDAGPRAGSRVTVVAASRWAARLEGRARPDVRSEPSRCMIRPTTSNTGGGRLFPYDSGPRHAT